MKFSQGFDFSVHETHIPEFSSPEEYARLACECMPLRERDPGVLYAAPAIRVLELSAAMGENADGEIVLALGGAILRYALAPALCLGGDLCPPLDFARISRRWKDGACSGRYLAALRQLQRVTGSLLSNAQSMLANPPLRRARVDLVARQTHELIDSLETVLGYYGYTLHDAAKQDLAQLYARENDAVSRI